MADNDEMLIDLSDDEVKELEKAYGVGVDDGDGDADPLPAAKPAAPKAKPSSAKAGTLPAASPKPDNDLLRRVQDAETRLAEERRLRAAADLRSHDLTTQVAVTRARAADSDYHAASNALIKATADAEVYKQAHRAALEAGDYEKASDAADRLSEAKAKVVQLQDGKAALEDAARRAISQAEVVIKTPAPKAEPADPFEGFLAQFAPKAQAWFREHPECAATNDKSKWYQALAAHESILRAGVADGTDEYFVRLDKAMGYDNGSEAVEDRAAHDRTSEDVVVDTKATPTKPAPRVSAPVSRDSTIVTRRADGRMQVRLTAEQRDIAEHMGMSTTEYAKYMIAAERQGLLTA